MRIPRDLNGADLAKRLGQFGYTITRQSGSHMRLTRIDVGREQHLTIPAHKPRVGTLR
ncbi:MAG: type II toxin-antitoxin system HicA family toxin [Synechococcaceae cyanobacterium]